MALKKFTNNNLRSLKLILLIMWLWTENTAAVTNRFLWYRSRVSSPWLAPYSAGNDLNWSWSGTGLAPLQTSGGSLIIRLGNGNFAIGGGNVLDSNSHTITYSISPTRSILSSFTPPPDRNYALSDYGSIDLVPTVSATNQYYMTWYTGSPAGSFGLHLIKIQSGNYTPIATAYAMGGQTLGMFPSIGPISVCSNTTDAVIVAYQQSSNLRWSYRNATFTTALNGQTNAGIGSISGIIGTTFNNTNFIILAFSSNTLKLVRVDGNGSYLDTTNITLPTPTTPQANVRKYSTRKRSDGHLAMSWLNTSNQVVYAVLNLNTFSWVVSPVTISPFAAMDAPAVVMDVLPSDNSVIVGKNKEFIWLNADGTIRKNITTLNNLISNVTGISLTTDATRMIATETWYIGEGNNSVIQTREYSLVP
jgi:hypothetical protein